MSPREFYVGYEEKAPEGLARFRVRAGIVFVLGFVAAMTIVALGQRRLPPGEFDFGKPRAWEGVFFDTPVPMLIPDPDANEPTATVVGLNKFGVPDALRFQTGKRVRFQGTRIEAGGFRMIELSDPQSIEVLDDGPVLPPNRIDGGDVTLRGELVDTKCFLGVMRPGEGKVHRACAARCLSGGVPPGLLVRRADGSGAVFYLAGPEGDRLVFNPQWAARLVEARGHLYIVEGVLTVYVDRLTLDDTLEGDL